MKSLLKDLWLRAVVFNKTKDMILLDKKCKFPKSIKVVPLGTSLKGQVSNIVEKIFNFTGSEVGKVVYLGLHIYPEGAEVFIRVILKKEVDLKKMGLNNKYIWVDKYDIKNLDLDPVTQEILQNIFQK